MASRIRAVVESAKEKPLHEKELSDLAYSHGQLIHAVFGRIETIKKGETAHMRISNDTHEKFRYLWSQ